MTKTSEKKTLSPFMGVIGGRSPPTFFYCHYVYMYSVRKTKKAKSLSPQQNKLNLQKSLGRRRVRSMRKTRSLNDLSREVADDLTRDTNARLRINGRQNRTWKGNHSIPLKYQSEKSVQWKGKPSAVDIIQRLPRELQSTVFKMGRMENPVKTKKGKLELKTAASAMALSIRFKRFIEDYAKYLVYGWVEFTEYGDPLRYNTNFFTATDAHIFWHNKKVFATSIEEFVDKTKIQLSVDGDFIRFRIIPKEMNMVGREKDYDGLFILDTFKRDFFSYLTSDDYDIYNGDVDDAFSADMHPAFDDRTRSFLHTHFSNLSHRFLDFIERVYTRIGVKFIFIRFNSHNIDHEKNEYS